jgi:hypothetical protein
MATENWQAQPVAGHTNIAIDQKTCAEILRNLIHYSPFPETVRWQTRSLRHYPLETRSGIVKLLSLV